MSWVFVRLVMAVGGASLAAFVVSLVEARAMARAADGGGGASLLGASATVAGLLLPLVLAFGALVGLATAVIEPRTMRTPGSWLALLREGPVLDKLRRASLLPLLAFVGLGFVGGAAHLGLDVLSVGTPRASGWSLALASVAWMAVLVAVALALLPLVRRTLAFGAQVFPRLLDPVFTGGVALAVVLGLVGLGMARGDASGEGGGWLGIFGVLLRPELDLKPVGEAAILLVGAYLGALAASPRPGAAVSAESAAQTRRQVVGALVVTAALGVLAFRASSVLDASPSLARAVSASAPLGRPALGVLRRVTDRDHDGASSRFGGGDCNDTDPNIHPDARDIPGNGIDEDCSGADTPAPVLDVATVTSATAPRAPRAAHNVILITIDTLRTDVGFLGYRPSPTPNLDALAEKSAVFERAYAMASYTGKSVGPMLIGKYPSETRRDGSHFNTYFASNTFVAERARDAGFRTFAAHCHWYFRNPTGLNQGMDIWDTSAMPPGLTDKDTSVSSDRLADVALRLLASPENVGTEVPGAPAGAESDGGTSRHFFAWFHFFDPHAQYVEHAGAPKGDGVTQTKGLYDGEVWFTDQHVGRILDHVAKAPWGKDTAIVVTADHGEAFSDHGMNWHGRELWESLVRVPLLIYIPGEKPVRIPVKRSQIDLVPTLLELMGIPLPDAPGELRGRSLLADLAVENGNFEERDVFLDMPMGPYNPARRAIITGPTPGMKLIHFGGSNYQLYDLAHDPDEAHDLASDKVQRARVAARMDALRARLDEVEVKPVP